MDSALVQLPKRPTPEAVKAFEHALAKLPQASAPVRHFIGHGMVTRVIFIPAGVALTGKKHLQGQHNFLMLGTIAVTTEDGVREITAPEVIVSPPGTKRAAVALTDVIWATTLICDKTDIADIEAQVIDPTDEIPIVNLEVEPCLTGP